MRILIVNDDGMEASRLPDLIRWCRKLGEVTAVVPKFEQSGKSHSFEGQRAFEAKQVRLTEDITLWAVDSTPADCVRFAVLGMGMAFDLCISGINRGYNMGRDIMYSGTVAAASEAVNLGIPAIALSTSVPNYDHATEMLDHLATYFHTHRLMEWHNFYNVNIPPQPRGIKITAQGGHYYSDDFLPQGEDLYLPKGKPVWVDSGDDTLDTDATKHGYITITPLQLDRTDRTVYDKLRALGI
ncbi:MAG: 5'/3'-nucleotidase SurE [Oscillospiraceae bacterium]|nr:5'/3'-nucleotidase SurE [Oscillospiraceae bacterium]